MQARASDSPSTSTFSPVPSTMAVLIEPRYRARVVPLPSALDRHFGRAPGGLLPQGLGRVFWDIRTPGGCAPS